MSEAAAQPHILVVDDDTRLRALLQKYLSQNGFAVSLAADAKAARQCLDVLAVDLMVLDIMMPVEDGLSLTAALRRAEPDAPYLGRVPILLLTARGGTDDRILGLEAGADDYLAKPFEPRELLLRINAILRRSARPVSALPELPQIGPWQFDAKRSALMAGDDFVPLTSAEAALLQTLLQSANQPLSREELAERSRAADGEALAPRTVDVQVTRLRRKLEADPRLPRHLITVRGAGYMLVTGDGEPPGMLS